MSLFDYRDFLGALGGLFSGGGSAPKILSELIQQLFGGTADGKILDDELDIVGPAELQGVYVLNFPAGGVITTAEVTGTEVLTHNGTATLTAGSGIITVGVGTVSQISIDGVMTYPCEEGPHGANLLNVSDVGVGATHDGERTTSNLVPSWFHQKGGTVVPLELDFLSTWGSPVTPNTTITMPTDSAGTYSGTINWGDGTGDKSFASYNDANFTHTYVDIGFYQVRISGTFSQLDNASGAKDGVYCRGIQNLGYVGWTTLDQAFRGWYNIESFDAGTAELSKVVSMNFCFYGCNKLTDIKFESLDISSNLTLNYAFSLCPIMTSVSVKNCDLCKTTILTSMFITNPALTSVDLSGSNFSGVTTGSAIYAGSANIATVDLTNTTLPTSGTAVKNFTTSGTAKKVILNNTKTASNSYKELFLSALALEEVEISNVPSNIASYEGLFNGSGIKSVDLELMDFSNITNMERMFFSATKLESFNLSNKDLSKVTTMTYLFYNCDVLPSVTITNCDCRSLTIMTNMFSYCDILTSIDYSGSNFAGVTTAGSLYISTPVSTMNLNNVILPALETHSNLLTSDVAPLVTCYFDNVNTASNSYFEMFKTCTSLTDLRISNVPSNITSMENMFESSGIQTVDFTGLDLSNIVSWDRLFYTCSTITSFTARSMDMSSLTSMQYMFQSCSALIDVTLKSCDFSSVTTVSNLFSACANLETIDCSGSNFAAVTTSASMYTSALKVSTVNLNNTTLPALASKVNTFTSNLASLVTCHFDNVKTAGNSYEEMFENSTNLTNLYWSNMPSNITDLSYMFEDSGIPNVDWLSGLDLSNVTDMQWMFSYCDNLTGVSLAGKDMSSLTTTYRMFHSCDNLTNISFTNCDFSSVAVVDYMFSGCPELASTDWSGSNFESITNNTSFHTDNTKLTTIKLDDVTLPALASKVNTFTSAVASLVTCHFDNVKTAGNSYEHMFEHCTNLTNLYWSNMPSNITDLSYMLEYSGLTSFDLTNIDLSNVTDMQWMLSYCDNLTGVSLAGRDLSSLTTTYRMFHSCLELTNVDFTGALIPNVSTMQYMFALDTLSTASYSAMLKVFADQMVQSSVQFDGGLSKYNAAGLVDRDVLTSVDNWDISDGGAE
jgi:hypothetical protein